jgi:hypothetical protein
MKKRLGQSPDLSAALCLAFYQLPEGPESSIDFF